MEAKIISFLQHHPQQNTVNEIAELRMLSKGNVSTSVDKLIRNAILEKKGDPSDGRRFLLFLTPQANPITAEIEKIRDDFFRTLFCGFSDEERNTYAAFRKRMTENILTMAGKE